jgi:hypothetical protein
LSYVIAAAHIIGSVITVIAFGAGVLALSVWQANRNRKAAAAEISIALGVPMDRLDDAENAVRVVQFSAARFSSELLRNRLSDFCGWIQSAWGWLGNLFQVGVFLAVIWYTFAKDTADAVHAWWVVAIAFFFWVTSVAFGLICKLLTGRSPGQARQARKFLAEFVENQARSATLDED